MARSRYFMACASLTLAAACSPGSDEARPEASIGLPTTTDGPVRSTPNSISTPALVSDSTSVAVQPVADPAAALYDQEVVNTFDIVIEPVDLAFLDADPAAEEYVDGFLDFDGERYGPIGVRYKGSFGAFVGCVEDTDDPERPRGAKTCTKLSLKLKFDGRYDVDFFGVDKVQLHSQNLDPTMMHERLGYAMFREFGVPAPRSTHTRVTMNGELLGLFALTEQIDEEFLPTVFDDPSGNLYKEAWPVADDPRTRSDEYFRDRLRTNEDDPLAFDPIEDLGVVVDEAGEGERLPSIEPLVDVDGWFRYLVVDRAIGHDDGPLRFDCPGTLCGNKNHYLYQHPATGEISIIAWDLDVAFATLARDPVRADQFALDLADAWDATSNDCEPFAHGPAGLIQRSAACDPLIAAFAEDVNRYDQLRTEFIDGPYSRKSVDALLDAWSTQIEPFVAEAAATDPDAISVENWLAEVDALRSDIAAERNRRDRRYRGCGIRRRRGRSRRRGGRANASARRASVTREL